MKKWEALERINVKDNIKDGEKTNINEGRQGGKKEGGKVTQNHKFSRNISSKFNARFWSFVHNCTLNNEKQIWHF